MNDGIDELCVNTIRTLSMDAVQAANSGHPGTPMAMAPVAYTAWQYFMKFDPDDPTWPNRDRFVLSIGHASMLLYSMLYLCGVKSVGPEDETHGGLAVSMEDIKNFRQIDSRCPGHPEYRWTSGVETTTGPLGQGVAVSVGMAIAGKWMADYFNRPGFDIIGYDVYALCGDGCMMEGITSEAASLAGHLKLSNLCWIYDSNKITIEGGTKLAFSEDVAARFIAYGWNVTHVSDANDAEALKKAFATFKNSAAPTLIIVDSHIAYGSPNKQDTSAAHGAPLGDEEIRLTKQNYDWPTDTAFHVPDGVREHFQAVSGKRGNELRKAWMAQLGEYRKKYPELAEQFSIMQNSELPENWDEKIPKFAADAKGMAGRDASGKILNAIAQKVPWLIGGSADLSPSTKTRLTFEGAGDFTAGGFGGRNIHFGVREHAMGAILNGLSHCKIRPYASGFMVFSDYSKPAIRLSALMELPVIHVFTHDSIGVGEDGPTHQPIEQLASLRAVPGLITLRPADASEVVQAWRIIMRFRREPVALVLSRQALPTLDRSVYASEDGLAKGAYILADADDGKPDVLLLASGSEVSICVSAYEQLKKEGVKARVVSMPSWELFEKQTKAYRESVIPADITSRVSVEMGSTMGWSRYVGPNGSSIGIDRFGASAPLKELQKKFGFTLEHVVIAAKGQIEKVK